ncbi:MAG: hypothetical protein ABJE10_19115 [bacterium]
MSTPSASLTFVPWVRQGVATAINSPDTLTATPHAVVDISVALAVNAQAASSVSVPIRLRGPADVIGIDANQVIRMDPHPGTTDYEPTYFPCIEFDRPDYPWLFTPASADAKSKLRPWMCLVVVRKQAGVTLGTVVNTPLPMLQITGPAKPASELPDLADCWAWAHAQAASTDNSYLAVKTILGGPPQSSLSRLVCPRVLVADTDYIACVVPTFELGRRTGLGTPVTEADLTTAATPLAPAWTLKQGQVQLPVYFSWEFRTGAGGDFQTLASRLHPELLPATFGRRAVSIATPGFLTQTPLPANAELNVEGGLQPTGRGATAEPWDPQVAQNFRNGLITVINAPALNLIANAAADPLLAPPLYGSWHAQKNQATQSALDWFNELNLDPRLRTVAALGTKVVQEHQEALMASAWDQAEELFAVNQRMRQLQLSLAVNESIHARHISKMSDEAILRVAAPAYSRLRATSGNVATMINGSTLPMPAVNAAMRRLGRHRGPMSRRITSQGGPQRVQAQSWVARLSYGFPAPIPPLFFLLGSDNELSPSSGMRSYQSTTAAAVAAQPKRPFWIYPDGQIPAVWPGLPFTNPSFPADDASAADFRRTAIEHLTAVNPGRLPPRVPTRPLVPLSMTPQIMSSTQPRPAFKALADSTLTLGANATPAVVPGATALGVESVMIAPKFPQPMYETLRDLSQELLVPGLENIPPDCIVGLETNRRFVESFMVGLNFEMGRELLWRGYPTDQRGTYFDQFWGVAPSSPPRPDIMPLDLWGTRVLGSANGQPPREQFVMLMRSALLRRYPNALIYLTRAVVVNGVRTPSMVDTDELFPVFSGAMQPDVSFFGFDITPAFALTGNGNGYYLVIQEHPTEPRFGLTVTPPATTIHVNANAAIPTGQPIPSATPPLQWGLNAAQMAAITRRLPVRLAIHASLLIEP